MPKLYLIWDFLCVGVAAVTLVPNNLNHCLNYSHNNDAGALHYGHYCREMGWAEVKDESYLWLSVGALVIVTGPSDLCSGSHWVSRRRFIIDQPTTPGDDRLKMVSLPFVPFELAGGKMLLEENNAKRCQIRRFDFLYSHLLQSKWNVTDAETLN